MALHGRDLELGALLAAVAERRLVTLTGPVGVGKSRLVREAAVALRDVFGRVEEHALAGIPAGSDAATILGHLGFGSADALALQLAEDGGLLVLDGCDHVHPGTAELVAELLAANEAASVVVTAREPLHLAGEQVQVLTPLPVPDPDDPEPGSSAVVALFVECSRAAGASWAADRPTLSRVADICRALDGLPLAVELAAARSRALSLDDLHRALRRRLDLLDAAVAGSGLRAALAESLDQLDERARTALRRLSVLPDAFDTATAHAVVALGDDELDTLNALDRLVDRSLLLVDNTATTAHYRLLGVIRELAADDLVTAGEQTVVWDRFADVMAATADRLVAAGLRRWSGQVVGGIATRITLLLAAADWCIEHDESPDRALRIFLPMFGGVHQSRSPEARRCGERLFARWPETPAPLRAECLAVLATAAAIASDVRRARDLAEAALADPAVTGVGLVVAHRALVLAALAGGDLALAGDHVTAGEAAAVEAGMEPFARELRTFRASLADRAGRGPEGRELAVAVAREAEQSDDAVTELWARVVAANIAARAEDWAGVREEVAAARLAWSAAATEDWSARVFRSDALLEVYDAVAVAHLDGWALSVPRWRRALLTAAAGGGVLEVATTVRAAAVVARRVGQVQVAGVLDTSIPATPELDVLPEVVVPEQPLRANPRLRLADAYHAALDAVGSGGLTPLRTDGGRDDDVVGLLRRDGDTWEISYGGATARVRHLKGIADLAVLVARSNTEVHALELMGVVQVGESTGPAIDDQARQSYRTQILDLQEEIDDARAAHDTARAERAEDELDALVSELSSTLGLGGRGRETGSTAERARSAVTFRIRAAIKRIAEHHDALGRHLRNSVRTGTWCSYAPEMPVSWEVDPG